MFKNRLVKVYRHLAKQAARQRVTCFRIYDHDLPEFPFIIEKYDEVVYVSEYKRFHNMEDEEHAAWLAESVKVISEVSGVSEERIFIKLRRRKEGREGQYQRVERERRAKEQEEEEGQREKEKEKEKEKQKEKENETRGRKTDEGINATGRVIVEEGGLKFLLNLTDYLDTGLFLDHRITRGMVRELSADKRILNLFSYTGSFSVYAIAGKAKQVISVDLSKTYLAWGERNIELNFPDYKYHNSVHADVKEYLKKTPSKSFDIIVMDPPTFSNSKRMNDFLDTGRDHPELINECLRILSDDGVLFFSTNFTKFELRAEEIHSTQIKDITKKTTPFDFEGKLKRQCFEIRKI